MKKSQLLATGVVGLAVVLVLAFQNCSVRRLSDMNNQSSTGVNLSAGGDTDAGDTGDTDDTGGTGDTTGGSPGVPSGGGGGGSCLISADTAGTVMGITGQPAIRSSYAMVTRQTATPPYIPAATMVNILMNSTCTAKSALTAGGKCPKPTACVSAKSFSVTITLKCDSASDTVNACTNFASKFGQDIDLNDATLGPLITLSASNSTNICDTTGASTSTYMPILYGTPKEGKINITSFTTLASGTVVKAQLKGVKMFKNGASTGTSITVDGTYAGEIVAVKACTP